jgi:hypothetical protein
MQQQSVNSELILSKEQLYDMFQQILGIKKFEHQLLFNALQVYGASFEHIIMIYCMTVKISYVALCKHLSPYMAS